MRTRLSLQYGMVLGILSGVLLLPVSQVQAGENGKMGMDKKAWQEKVEKMYDQLELNEQQREALKAQKVKHREEQKAMREKLQAKREALREELQKEAFDKKKVKALNEDVKNIQNQMSDQRLESVIGVREILTPEQFSKFNEKKEEHWKKREERRDGFRDQFKEHMKERNTE